MKRDEAEQVWGMIASLYDLHPERRGEQAVVWIPALEGMDAEIVMTIVDSWMKGRGPETLPKLPWFSKEVEAVVLSRQPQRHWDDQPSCAVCSDTGMVVVGFSQAGTEEMAPCPSCERGRSLEFPLESVGHWGPEGFWRGRSWRKEGVDTVVIEG